SLRKAARPGVTRAREMRPRFLLFLVRRNLDQAAVGVPAIDREQRATGALLSGRAFLDPDTVRLQMRDHLVRRTRSEEAKIVAAGGFVIGGEPLDLVGTFRPNVDLLGAEHQ